MRSSRIWTRRNEVWRTWRTEHRETENTLFIRGNRAVDVPPEGFKAEETFTPPEPGSDAVSSSSSLPGIGRRAAG
ncbi:hypothetical protein PBY51_025029 [Eleginops maclovinus]|uniref:Uncharacterized protein n=1 Tax=Eleginops maclovinus TaxID=56733 RepID=A0AAN7Y0M7_ELEMC|nr:hypothetical protein PBY51_025029 [Eleginops maclovinus]